MPSHRVFHTALLSSVVFAACASTGSLGIDPQSSTHARVNLVPAVTADTSQVVPRALDPQLRSADRLARLIDAQLGERASLDVRLCITPAGRVSSATVERGSTLAAFDDAVMSDVASWQFAAQPGPASLRTCETATIVYRPHR